MGVRQVTVKFHRGQECQGLDLSLNSFIKSPLKLKMVFSNLGVSDVSNSVYCIFLRMKTQLDWTFFIRV